MPKPLDEIVDVIRDCLMGIDFEDTTSEVAAREILASLETEGYAVTRKDASFCPALDGLYLRPDGVTVDKDGRVLSMQEIDAHLKRPGISHPQAPYTPEPRKEES